jgi:hypothetical protein
MHVKEGTLRRHTTLFTILTATVSYCLVACDVMWCTDDRIRFGETAICLRHPLHFNVYGV